MTAHHYLPMYSVVYNDSCTHTWYYVILFVHMHGYTQCDLYMYVIIHNKICTHT